MKRRRFTSMGRLLEIVLAAILFVCLMLLLLWYREGLESFKPEEETYYFIAGDRVSCSETTRFTNTKEGLKVKDGDVETTMDKTPIYSSTEKKIILSANQMLQQPGLSARVSKVNAFTTVVEKNGRITFRLEDKSANADGGFLYDGDNTYIFLEPVTIRMGAVKKKLPTLSYAKVVYKSFVELYNTDTDKFEWISLVDVDVFADSDHGYTLDMGKDLIHHGDVDALLFNAVDELELIEMK